MFYDLIIIGAGPAGLTAGIYAGRKKLNTVMIAKSLGGQMAKKAVLIENYPGFEEISGLELLERMEKQLKKQEVKIENDSVLEIKKEGEIFKIKTQGQKEFQSKTVIIASGAEPRYLIVTGEKEFLGKGVSYCANCDGPLFSDKTVAVIGGGNNGFETALFLTEYARKVYIFETGSQIHADKIIQEKVIETKKAEIITDVLIKEIQGKNFVENLIYQDNKTKEIKNLKTEGVFIEIGYQPANSFVKELVDFNQKGEITVDPKTFQTKTAGLFAAGDVNEGLYKQIIIAAGQGGQAALAVYDFIQKQKK